MVMFESVEPADGDGLLIEGQDMVRVIGHEAFRNTFGETAVINHILSSAMPRHLTKDKVACVPEKFPQYSIEWMRTENGELDSSATVYYRGTLFMTVDAKENGSLLGYDAARLASKKGMVPE